MIGNQDHNSRFNSLGRAILTTLPPTELKFPMPNFKSQAEHLADAEWTKTHSEAAKRSGWDLAQAETQTICSMDLVKLPNNDAALGYVHAMAECGNQLAILALTLHGKKKEKIIKTPLGDRHLLGEIKEIAGTFVIAALAQNNLCWLDVVFDGDLVRVEGVTSIDFQNRLVFVKEGVYKIK